MHKDPGIKKFQDLIHVISKYRVSERRSMNWKSAIKFHLLQDWGILGHEVIKKMGGWNI